MKLYNADGTENGSNWEQVACDKVCEHLTPRGRTIYFLGNKIAYTNGEKFALADGDDIERTADALGEVLAPIAAKAEKQWREGELMTIGDARELCPEAASVEVFTVADSARAYGDANAHGFLSAYIEAFEDWREDFPVLAYQLMDEEEFNSRVWRGCAYAEDFTELYGDKNAKVLCVLTRAE